jgi:hypothetical protein
MIHLETGAIPQQDNSMKTFFIRHGSNFSISDETVDRLRRERKIAVHYPRNDKGHLLNEDNTSLNPDDYSGRDAGVIRRFVELATDGGFVCATYRTRPFFIIGIVKPKTCPEIFTTRWTSDPTRVAKLKTLQLSSARELTLEENCLLSVTRPRMVT